MEVLKKIAGPVPEQRLIVILLLGVLYFQYQQVEELEDLPDYYPESCGVYEPCDVRVTNTVDVSRY